VVRAEHGHRQLPKAVEKVVKPLRQAGEKIEEAAKEETVPATQTAKTRQQIHEQTPTTEKREQPPQEPQQQPTQPKPEPNQPEKGSIEIDIKIKPPHKKPKQE